MRSRQLVCLYVLAGITLAGSAVAGDAGGNTSNLPAINPQLDAPRFVAGSNTTAPGHLNNFSPLAINYADCLADIDIQFSLDLSNIPANDEIQAWAGSGSADCTETSARTAGKSTSPDVFPGRCWPVAPAGTFASSGTTSTGRLHVRDLVSYMGQSSIPVTYTRTTSSSVCKPPGAAAVSLGIYFILVPSGSGSGDAGAAQAPIGISGRYQTPAALVGPFAPTDVQLPTGQITPTTLTVTWTPQSESVIQGFNVYVVNQGPNGANATVPTLDDAGSTHQEGGIYCRARATCSSGGSSDSGGTSEAGGSKDAGGTTEAGGSKDAGDAGIRDGGHDATLNDAAGGGTEAGGQNDSACDAGFTDAFVPVDSAAYPDASQASLAEAGCELLFGTNSQNTGSQAGTPSCFSPVFTNQFTVDGGLGTTATTTSDAALPTSVSTTTDASLTEGGTSGDSGSTAITSGTAPVTNVPEVAGISSIALTPYYVAGATSGSYTLTGLTTGNQYAVAVAAVDSYGNVGPIGVAPSPFSGGASGVAACSTPTAIDDFYTAYSLDGGQAGGGFCSVIAVGKATTSMASLFGSGLGIAAIARGRRRRPQRKKS